MATPVQRQYWELKNQNPDAILFFRLGDFYEMFFEDAELCSRLLGIVLTARHRGTESEMPMCGFPFHASEEYLEKLVDAGYKVAIAEQAEDPQTKAISRSIVRVVTPGTSLEKGNLAPEKNSFLAAVVRDGGRFALAYSDLSTGDFRTALFSDEIDFLDELYKISPREILLDSSTLQDDLFCKKLPRSHITPRKKLSVNSASETLKSHFGIQNLDALGLEKLSLLIEVSAQVLSYLKETQKTELQHISTLVRYESGDAMSVDQQTFQHLEIFEPFQNGEKDATLLSVFERPFTALGARRLRAFLANPMLSAEKINRRLEAVEEIKSSPELSDNFTKAFRHISDLERILSRLVTGRGNARDMAFLRDSLAVLPEVASICHDAKSSIIAGHTNALDAFRALVEKLKSALVESPPLEITAGGMIRAGFSESLDELRALTKDSKKWMEDFLERQKRESGISNLKIKFSNNFGFCLEVSQGQIARVPSDWIRRQTLVNAERFTTPELSVHEEKVLSSEAESFALEHRLFLGLRDEVLHYASGLREASSAIAELDTLLCFARTASLWRWNKPEVVDDSSELVVEKGRHPVVEKLSGEVFIANDLQMSEASRLHLITGPNMAGKSTFLRQNAILIFLAQIGSFVPAKRMKTGVCDRIFTRVGASDNLAAGKSTFYTEMTETARILRLATKKSFVILDEIGRGTSTFDGISLAWAITEFLHDKIQCKTLFATHFHELVELAEDLPHAENFHVSALQKADGIQFLRRVEKGGISDSFGIEVAVYAGIPKSVIENARGVLSRLESENLLSGRPNLFSIPRLHQNVNKMEEKSETDLFLEKLDPNALTPMEALEAIFRLKNGGKKS